MSVLSTKPWEYALSEEDKEILRIAKDFCHPVIVEEADLAIIYQRAIDEGKFGTYEKAARYLETKNAAYQQNKAFIDSLMFNLPEKLYWTCPFINQKALDNLVKHYLKDYEDVANHPSGHIEYRFIYFHNKYGSLIDAFDYKTSETFEAMKFVGSDVVNYIASHEAFVRFVKEHPDKLKLYPKSFNCLDNRIIKKVLAKLRQ